MASCIAPGTLQKLNQTEANMEAALNNLIERNSKLQRELEELKQETANFLRSVFENPENKHLILAQQLGKK